ncbi:MAG: hypothetical protein H0W88_00740 [Parachlamydiaceae bacterium]|nr:hypothetical protein [Parachlamydiaceae bacterium]
MATQGIQSFVWNTSTEQNAENFRLSDTFFSSSVDSQDVSQKDQQSLEDTSSQIELLAGLHIPFNNPTIADEATPDLISDTVSTSAQGSSDDEQADQSDLSAIALKAHTIGILPHNFTRSGAIPAIVLDASATDSDTEMSIPTAGSSSRTAKIEDEDEEAGTCAGAGAGSASSSGLKRKEPPENYETRKAKKARVDTLNAFLKDQITKINNAYGIEKEDVISKDSMDILSAKTCKLRTDFRFYHSQAKQYSAQLDSLIQHQTALLKRNQELFDQVQSLTQAKQVADMASTASTS